MTNIVRDLYLDRLRGDRYQLDRSQLRRYHVSLAGGEASYTVLADDPGELPRINYRYNGRDYGIVYLAGAAPEKRNDFINQLLKVDVRTGTRKQWSDDGCYPGEAVFVAAPDARAEDDGALLSVVLDSRSGRSFLLVLDARSFNEMARALVPHHIPFGFHGQYFR
jgi:carotenoid cleavage dioxygenase-like enzyme